MELKGKDFILRRLRTEDAPSLQKYADNVNVSSCLLDRFPAPYTIADAETFINLNKDQDPLTVFAIEINGEMAGGIGLEFRTDVYLKTPLIGYWLAEPYWGRGIVTETVKLITRYAFNNLDIICIMAFVFSKNPGSMRVLEKAGYEKQGVIRRSIIKG